MSEQKPKAGTEPKTVEPATEPPVVVATSLTLVESSVQPSLRVDRENHVIFGVKILGDTSKNRHPVSGLPYKYSDKALKDFAGLQEGTRVFLNHAKSGDTEPRRYEDQLGDFRNVTSKLTSSPRGNYGDLHYNPEHPRIGQVLHDAEHAPHRLAMSHMAVGAGQASGDYHVIEEGKSVASVDLVCMGATNETLFEGEHLGEKERCPTCQQLVPGEKNKMKEANSALTSRVAKLEGDIRLTEVRKEREAAVKAAGKVASESLMSHLATCNQSAATVIIEGLRGAPGMSPQSRDPNQNTQQFKDVDEFIGALGS